ncbi:ladderlectin-like isoform X1 [Alosa alosa]|nr:ladderlectin-like isoform X1 [Alosa alosa]
MKVLSLAVILCLFFAATLAAPAAEVPETQAEENTVPEETLEVNNMVEDQLPEAETEEAAVHKDLSPVVDRMVLCPPGWFRLGSHCFLLVTSRRSWLSAENYCVAQQGSLASVQSPDEYNFLQSLAQLSGQSVAWIGGFNFQGAWMWIDRAGFYYTNWYSQNSGSSYPCLYLRSSGGWSNTVCSSSYAFFCVRGPSCY